MLDEFSNRNWKKIGSRMLEPPGVIVLIMTEDGEVLIAKRDSYAETYNSPKYVSVRYGHIIENAIYWDYK